MSTRIGIDVGGTFTDLICYDEHSATVTVHKVPTVPQAPATGCLRAVREALPAGQLEASRQFFYGTTVGLNALLQRKGARVGFLVTRGFRDLLNLRRGSRLDIYNIFWRPPPPLVPRRWSVPITERMGADGTVHTPLARGEIQQALKGFRAEGIDSIAVLFLHAYANPQHELEAEAALRAAGFEGDITLSHRVSGEYREYERASTTVVDAFVRGRIAADLRQVEQGLQAGRFAGDLLVPRSGGGAMSFAEAEERPFEVIQSGPVGGAEGAAELARALGLGDVIGADVGGTSFDACVIQGGRVPLLHQGEVAGFPLLCPWVDVRSIGAGGGSIIWVDAGGLMHVGPQSAGAVPGPACYQRGGTLPTVTDAALTLGMLGEGRALSGVELDRQAAWRALEPLAAQLGFSVERVAEGAIRIAASKMAGTIRAITIDRGLDPRTMQLLAFGGAGPLFGTLLAGELATRAVVVPAHAGNFSAWGMLGADLVRTTSVTRILPVDERLPSAAGAILERLFESLQARKGGSAQSAQREGVLEVRYRGQEHALAIEAGVAAGRIDLDAEGIRGRFIERYRAAFGSDLGAEWPLEVVTVRATLRTAMPRRLGGKAGAPRAAAAKALGRGECYSFTQGRRVPFRYFERAALSEGEVIQGPAILHEPTATTYLDAGFAARVGAVGCLFITAEESAR